LKSDEAGYQKRIIEVDLATGKDVDTTMPAYRDSHEEVRVNLRDEIKEFALTTLDMDCIGITNVERLSAHRRAAGRQIYSQERSR